MAHTKLDQDMQEWKTGI